MRYRHSAIKPTLITSYTPTLRSAEFPNGLESNFDATLWNHSCNSLTRYHRHSIYRRRIRDHTNENTTLICEKWHLFHAPIPPRTNRLPFQIYDFYMRTFVRLISSFSRNRLFFRCNSFLRNIMLHLNYKVTRLSGYWQDIRGS
jgi:hypothetical protein